MQQADDLIDGLMFFCLGASRRILASMTLTLMDGFLLCGSHGLHFCGKLGRVRPVSQAYYESEKLFFGGALGMDGGSSEQAIAMQIEENSLEQMLEVEDAVTASLENLDLVVETFHKATILALDKKVGDLLPP